MRQTHPIIVGMILFPNLTQLDLTGPYEVFARMPNTVVTLIAETPAPIRSERGLTIIPDIAFVDTPQRDVHPVFEVFVTSDPGTTATRTATATPAQAAQRSYAPP